MSVQTRGPTVPPPTAGVAGSTAISPPAASAARGAQDYLARKPLPVRLLRALSLLLPGERLKTAFYLNCIDAPRRMLRDALFAFYRYDHVYAVLREFAREYVGNASVLEFGTSDGYSFVKLLYATRYLGLQQRIEVHTFDSFEGMPAARDARDRDWVGSDDWQPGEFRGRYAELVQYCREAGYANAHVHPGYFEQSVDDAFLARLGECPPILVWIDCDYYFSTRTVMERLIDHLPNGCVVYFDELDNLNFGSRFTGEARIVHEINAGAFGESIELVPDTRLGLQSRRVYRFFRLPPNRTLTAIPGENSGARVRWRGDGSPLP